MRKLVAIILGLMILASCQENQPALSEFTGSEITYSLQPGSDYPISGIVTFKERKDGSTTVVVNLDGTEGNVQLPVHLHLGNISEADADVAALLNPVLGTSGKSETRLTKLANEESITYEDLINLEACIKIHLAETGPDRNIILAGGNIGAAALSGDGGRMSISVCKSE